MNAHRWLATLALLLPVTATVRAAEPPARDVDTSRAAPAVAPTVAPTPPLATAGGRVPKFAPDDAALQWGSCPPLFAPGCQIAVLQGDPAKPNADIFFRVPPGYVIPPHSHTSAEHMVLVSGRLEVHYQGQPNTMLEKGDYAYGPAKLPHLAHCRSAEPCQLFISFDEPVDALPHEGEIR